MNRGFARIGQNYSQAIGGFQYIDAGNYHQTVVPKPGPLAEAAISGTGQILMISADGGNDEVPPNTRIGNLTNQNSHMGGRPDRDNLMASAVIGQQLR